MFVMMNSARLHVAMQGLGHLEAAQQNALAYAPSGCRCARPAAERQPADPTEHPAMRRTLWSLRALAEGAARHRLLDGDAARRGRTTIPTPRAAPQADAWSAC